MRVILTITSALTLAFAFCGCDDREIDQTPEAERVRTKSVPPQGLKQNPAQPRPERPVEP